MHAQRVPCWALGLASFPINFQSDHHVVICWLVECTIIWVWLQHSNQTWFASSPFIMCCLLWRFCLEATSLLVCNYDLASEENMVVILYVVFFPSPQGMLIVTFWLAENNAWLADHSPLLKIQWQWSEKAGWVAQYHIWLYSEKLTRPWENSHLGTKG